MPEGGTLTLEARMADDRVRIDVGDTGSGISTDVLSRIFDRGSRPTGGRGTGLGLSITRA